jgi:hypothetical protein
MLSSFHLHTTESYVSTHAGVFGHVHVPIDGDPDPHVWHARTTAGEIDAIKAPISNSFRLIIVSTPFFFDLFVFDEQLFQWCEQRQHKD